MNKSKKVWGIVLILALGLFIVAAGVSAYYIYSVFRAEKEYKELQAQIEAENAPTLEEVMEQDYTMRDGDAPEISSDLYLEDVEQTLIEAIEIDISNPIVYYFSNQCFSNSYRSHLTNNKCSRPCGCPLCGWCSLTTVFKWKPELSFTGAVVGRRYCTA
jgi:hypothetical protein